MVELVMTMVIIGIMAVVALPRLDMLRGFSEAGFRDQVKATLEYARKAAVAQRRYVCFDVNIGATGFAVTRDLVVPESRTLATVSCSAPLLLPGSSSNEIIAPTGTLLGGPSAAIIFDPLGRANGPAGADCTPAVTTAYCYSVQGAGSPTTHIVTIERETGYVH